MNIMGLRIALERRVSREDVLWCYRYILKREPEGETAITPHLRHRSFRSLVESFAQSSEARFTVSEEDVQWCFKHILGREPAADELTEAHLAHKNFRELAWSVERREQGLRALTREDVIAAYRYVLRRVPESDAAIEAHRSTYNFRTLVDALAASKEVTQPLTLDDVRWCFKHVLGRAPLADEDLTPYLAHKDFRALAQAFGEREGGLRAVTREDVHWAYKYLLGREVGLHETIAPQLLHANFRSLVENVANSNEAARFRKEGIAGMRRNIQIGLSAGMNTSTARTRQTSNTASLAELAQCLAKVKEHFCEDSEGHGSPTANAEQLRTRLSEHVRTTATVAHLVVLAANPEWHNARRPLATRTTVLGFAANATTTVDAALLSQFPPCDAFIADEMLHACPPPLAAALIRNGLRALAPGGVALICAATQEADTPFHLATWLREPWSPGMKHPLSVARVREIAVGQGYEVNFSSDPSSAIMSRANDVVFAIKKSKRPT